MSDKEIIERINAATQEIEVAERDLWRVTTELHASPRAQKRISDTVQKAFEELRAARARLVTLRDELDQDED